MFSIQGRRSFTKGRKVSARLSLKTALHHLNGVEKLTLETGWKCCKPRVLTFDEFLSIPPCTNGTHSAVDDTPKPEPAEESHNAVPAPEGIATSQYGAPQATPATRLPQTPQSAASTPAPPAPDSDSDDTSLAIPPNTTCRRRGCNIVSSSLGGSSLRDNEECIYHPGQASFHEGSKGWTCCKRRVLEFDEFMRIEGCKRKSKHLFVGSVKTSGAEEALTDVR